MAPLLAERAQRFSKTVHGNPRINVSEFARSKTWRSALKDEGCFEIIERGDTIGYIMDADWARSLADYIDEINEERELSSIRAMYEARKDSEYLSGEELKTKALEVFDKRAAEIEEFLRDAEF